MSDDRKKVWRAHLAVSVDAKKGHTTFCHYGRVTECGGYVDGGSVMWPIGPEWCDTEAEALARLAPQIGAIGVRLIQQAAELVDAAKAAQAAKEVANVAG